MANPTECLSEKSLGQFLRERLDANTQHNAPVPGVKENIKPDYRSEERKLFVEFHGNDHYQSTRKVIDDKKRDEILNKAGYRVVRIPYFVQMAERVIGYLFGDLITERHAFNLHPQGFSVTSFWPADFCELGVARLLDDLDRFALIRDDILSSLERAVTDRFGGDWRRVYPPSYRERLQQALSNPQCGSPAR